MVCKPKCEEFLIDVNKRVHKRTWICDLRVAPYSMVLEIYEEGIGGGRGVPIGKLIIRMFKRCRDSLGNSKFKILDCCGKLKQEGRSFAGQVSVSRFGTGNWTVGGGQCCWIDAVEFEGDRLLRGLIAAQVFDDFLFFAGILTGETSQGVGDDVAVM